MKQVEFERAQILPNHFAQKLKKLSKDLADSYKKERQMLEIIDKRDQEISRLKTELKAANQVVKERENYRERYNALAHSRLGKLQVGYWVIRAALRKKG